MMPRKISENWKHAYEILAGIPEERFVKNLRDFYKGSVAKDFATRCGTLACGAGWLALHPDFSDEEFDYEYFEKLGEKLGIDSFFIGSDDVFCIRDYSDYDYDDELEEDDFDELSDKQLLLYRIRRHLGQNPAKALRGAQTDAPHNQ